MTGVMNPGQGVESAVRWSGLFCIVAALPLVMLAACGKSHYDYVYRVTSVENGTTCVTLVSGLSRGTESDHVCDKWSGRQVIASRPIQVGDCVIVRMHPEGGRAQLILTDPTRCSTGSRISSPDAQSVAGD